MPERGFSIRALVIGTTVGAMGAVSNVYVSLKTGWSLPVMTTTAVVAIAIARLQRRALSGPEAVVATALSSATAFATGGGNLAALPAFVMLGGDSPKVTTMAAWFATTAILGAVLAPVLGRRLRQLEFPTATATATLVSTSGSERSHARALTIGAAGSSLFAVVRKTLRVPETLAGPYTLGLDTSLLLVAIGGLMSWTTAWSTVLGGVVTYGLVAPALVHAGLAAPTYRSLVAVMIWPAAALLVATSVTELALNARRLLSKATSEDADPRARWWLPIGPAAVALLLEHFAFAIPWSVAFASLPLAIGFAYVAARSMGETDTVPTKALAPLAQGLLGPLASGLAGPVLAPNLTGAVAIHAADTVGSLKVAERLGVGSGTAIAARVLGALIGAGVVATTFVLVVPDARALPTADLPGPAILVWKSVAEVVLRGRLPEGAGTPMVVGACLGIALTLLQATVPERVRRFLPSAMGVGSGMLLPLSASLSILLGSLARERIARRSGAEHAVALASGVLAGESLVSIVLQVWSSS